MPEHVIARADLLEVLTALGRERGEQLVYASPEPGGANLRVVTVVDENRIETRATHRILAAFPANGGAS